MLDLRGKKILELGAGTGIVSIMLANLGNKI
jgi:tRNA1(Val) A37 N6-methylase TrmN6